VGTCASTRNRHFVNFILVKASIVDDKMLPADQLAGVWLRGRGLVRDRLYLEKTWAEYFTPDHHRVLFALGDLEVLRKITWIRAAC